MNIFEYQGKNLFKECGIKVPEGDVFDGSCPLPEFKNGGVVKAQVLTGGRGKAGAIQVCKSSEEVKAAAARILEMEVKGHRVKKVLIEDRCQIEKEYYFSIFINRKKKLFTMMFTDQGGVNIEELPHEMITQVDVNPMIELKGYMIKRLLAPYGLDKDDQLTETIYKAYGLFREKKMQLLEINPLARNSEGGIVALDAKVVLDDWKVDESINPDELISGDLTEFERAMAAYDVTAVELDGDIIVMGGGAGAAMATADSIAQRGGTLRAIIDLGTLPSDSSDPETSEYAAGALRLLPELNGKVIFFNYYFQAGMLNYEAETLLRAYGDRCKTLPIVTRFKGNLSEEGRKILKDNGVYTTESYEEACEEVLRLAKEGK